MLDYNKANKEKRKVELCNNNTESNEQKNVRRKITKCVEFKRQAGAKKGGKPILK